MITRSLESLLSRSRTSFLLLGPRQTGKSTLVGGLRRDQGVAKPVFHLGDVRRRIGEVEVLPWQEGLREMGL